MTNRATHGPRSDGVEAVEIEKKHEDVTCNEGVFRHMCARAYWSENLS